MDFKARVFQTSIDVFVLGLLFQNVLEVLNSFLVLATREVGLSPSVVSFQVGWVKLETFIGVFNAGAIALDLKVGEGAV